MTGSKIAKATDILYVVGFAGNSDEAEWLIKNKKVFIDGVRVKDIKYRETFQKGTKYRVIVDEKEDYYLAY